MKRWNTLHQLQLDPSIIRIFNDFSSYRAIEELIRTKLKENPSDRYSSVLMVHSKADFMLDEFFRFIAERNLLNYVSLDCAMEHSVQPIGQFVSELYRKTPCFGHLSNIDWVHDLLSGNLESKRNSQRTIEAWLTQFRGDLLKRSDSMPVVLVLSYNHDNFDIKDIEGSHYKFEPTPTEAQEMQQLLIEMSATLRTKE